MVTSGPEPDADAGPADRTIAVEVTTRSLVLVAVALIIGLALVAAFEPAETALTRIGIGVVLAVALNPLVVALQRRGLGRRPAAVTVGASLLIAGVVLALLIGPATVDQAESFEQELPETVEGFYSLPLVGSWLEDNDAVSRVENFVSDLPAQIDNERIADTATSLVGGAVSTVIAIAVAFSVMLDGDRLVARIRNLIPLERRPAADHFARILYDTFGSYFGGSLTVAVLMGLWVLIIGLIFGVPLAPIAAIWAMITDLIPQIGGFLGGAFVTILALSVSVPTAIIVALLFVLYMNFENHVIQPAVIGQAVDLTPPSTMMAALIGGAAAGVPGALVATPLLGAGKRLYTELRTPASTKPAERRPSFIDRIRALGRRRLGRTSPGDDGRSGAPGASVD